MIRTEISSTTNPLIKQARSLRNRKARAESGLFLVEGLHLVGEALAAGWPVEHILYAPELLTSSFGMQLVEQGGDRAQPVSRAVMESIADKENPQGILAVAGARESSLQELAVPAHSVSMVSPQDPGNVGTLLRTMDAAGAEALVLADGGVDPYHPTCVRASMGAIFWKPLVQTSFADMMTWAGSRAIHTIATSAHAAADYRSLRPEAPWMLVLGSEQKGLSADQLAACETAVSLPMRGRASSLNLAVAGSILLYHFLSSATE